MGTDAPAQTVFDFICPVRAEGLMRPDQVAGLLGFDRSYVYDLVLEGLLEAHRKPGCDKSHLRITRRSVVAYLARTALYKPDDFAGVLEKLALTLEPRQRRELAERLLNPR